MEDTNKDFNEDINNKENLSTEDELKDFQEEDISVFQLAKDIEEQNLLEDGVEPSKENEENVDLTSKDENVEENKEEIKEEIKEENKEENKEELSLWEELGADNSVVKKYIFYVSKDFVPYIDNLTADERTAYINDAIQKKIDLENEQLQKEKKQRTLVHLLIMFIIFCFSTPFVLYCVHKSIMVTFENYKYSQDSFEKLYKERFNKDRAYMRSVEYNKQLEKKLKEQTQK